MDRLFKTGLVSTMFGVSVLIFCGALVYQGKSTPSELAGWFLFGTTLLRANDTLLGLPPSTKG